MFSPHWDMLRDVTVVASGQTAITYILLYIGCVWCIVFGVWCVPQVRSLGFPRGARSSLLLGRSWDTIGSLWGALVCLGVPWAPLKHHWATFGRPFGSRWPPLGHLGTLVGFLWGACVLMRSLLKKSNVFTALGHA